MSFQLEPDGTDLPADEQYRPHSGGPAHHAEATSCVHAVPHWANVEPFTTDVFVWPASYWPVAQVRTAEALQRSEASS